MEQSEIRAFYKGINVLLTGGTGFMGKIIVEKLLRDTEVETIYIIAREKKGRTAHMRIDELFDDVVFDRLKSEKPKYRNRVEAIPGDCSITGLGLSITDRQKLISNIHVIFHVAATVNFNEQIKLAYSINVNGTRDMVDLARETTGLKSFLHVSTAYSNCPRSEIKEEIYDNPNRCSDIEAVLDKMTLHESNICTERILGDWPNTYTFTKALGESLVKEMGSGLPIGIFRPSIVVSTYREPVAGWIDNIYGPTGMAVGCLSGVLRAGYGDKRRVADMVPVDTCVAGMIAAVRDIAQKEGERKAENIPVYNYASSPENPVTFEEFIELSFIHGMDFNFAQAIWCPLVILTKNPYIYWILKLILHIIPGTIMDLFCLIMGTKPKLLKIYKKVHKFSDIISFFSLREWTFTNKNTQTMWKKLNKTDQELFPFSMTTVSWLVFFRNYVKGIRTYLMKESDDTLEAANKQYRRFVWYNRLLMVILAFIACHLVTSILSQFYTFLFS